MQLVYRQTCWTGGRFSGRVFAMAMLAAMILFVSQITASMHPTIHLSGMRSTGSPNGEGSVMAMIGTSGDLAKEDGIVTVQLTVDGETTGITVESGLTVAQILEDAGVTLGEYDSVSPKLDTQIMRNRPIVVKRVSYAFETVEEEVVPTVVYKETSLLPEGETKTIQSGNDGLRRVTYMTRYVDGQMDYEKEWEETVVDDPVDHLVLVGAQVAISPLVFEDVPLDENGEPVQYSQIFTNQVATGYSARQGSKTASGRHAITGHVAVDPRQIPYGSRLYITSADNSFIYGYAIAADTGVGLMQDIIDVDLFYDTYRESAMNGRKLVNIYVLD